MVRVSGSIGSRIATTSGISASGAIGTERMFSMTS